MSKINLAFGGTFNVADGDEHANFIAFNGTDVTPYYSPGTKANAEYAVTKVLARDILNLLGFNSTLVTTRSQVPKLRNTFVGQDTKQNNFTPSVDGIFYGDWEGFNQQQFYAAYEKTNISSLAGLYSLYEYGQKNGTQGLGAAAQASYGMINAALSNNPDAQEFYSVFLNTAKNLYDSAWTDWTYVGTQAPTTLNSKVLSFDMQLTEPKTQADGDVNDFQLSGTAEKPNLGTEQNYDAINTSVADTEAGPIGNNKRAPYDLNLFTLEDTIGAASFNLDPNFKPAKGSNEINGLETWEIRHASDPNAWAVTATEEPLFDVQDGDDVKTQDKSWTNGFIKTNNTVLAKVAPLQIKLTYTSNVRDSGAQKYDLSFTLDGLTAAFAPFIRPSSFKNEDDGKNIGNRFLKWQFTHYQFTNDNDTWVNTKSINANDPNNGFFSNIAIKNLLIEKHSN